MKLRLARNSIRLRLAPEEIERFAREGSLRIPVLEAAPPLLGFSFTLRPRPGIASICARLEGSDFVIEVPESEAASWLARSSGPEDLLAEYRDASGLEIIIERDLKPHGRRGSPRE